MTSAVKDASNFAPSRPTLKITVDEKRDPASRLVFEDKLKKSSELQAASGVAFLKIIDRASEDAFRARLAAAYPDADKRAQVERVVFESNLAGVKEGSDQFFELLSAKCDRMSLCRDLVTLALADPTLGPSSGFGEFERALVTGCAKISDAYDKYWQLWMRAVQDPTVNAAIEDTSAETKANRDATAHFLSPYTIIRARKASAGGYAFEVEPYAVFFESALAPVLAAFDACLASLRSLASEEGEHLAIIAYLQQYRLALGERDIDNLEAAWNLCDRKWMDVKGNIQVVHDIEDGYSDPLRAKQGPDFSLRFLDDTYAAQNDTIKSIHGHICDYYRGRNTPLASNGLTALGNTLAGIYYIPFKTGCSLVFSYSGQSIPNRLDVKKEKGVKIFFDAVETAARVEQVKLKIPTVFANGAAVLEKYRPDAVEQLVWHVAAHEVGHAIYGISNMKDHIQKASIMHLEEPRAEFTAMFTLRLLHRKGVITLPDLKKYLVHFLLDALRYFAKFKSMALQPYINFQIHAFNTYFKHGMLRLEGEGDSRLVVIDDSPTLAVLDDFSATFEDILDGCDMGNAAGGQKLEAILDTLRKPTDSTLHVVELANRG